MNSRFDDLAKGAANGMSRRDVVRGAITGGFVAALAMIGVGKASADPSCQQLCAAIYPPPRGKETQNAYGKCVSGCQDCLHNGGTPCVPGACCDPADQHCEAGTCKANCDACFEQETCGAGCGVVPTTEEHCFCHQGSFCSDLSACDSSADCPDGWACAHTCCELFGFGTLCVPPCGGTEATSATSVGSGPRTMQD